MKYSYKCYYCECFLDEYTTTKDHFIPKSKGGYDDEFNIVECCFECNQRKRSLLAEDFIPIKSKTGLPRFDKNGKRIFTSFPKPEDKSEKIKADNSAIVFSYTKNKINDEIKRAYSYFLNLKDINCRHCNCFLDQNTLCVYLFGTKDETKSKRTYYFVASCYDCQKNQKNKQTKKCSLRESKILPSKDKNGIKINW